MTDSLSTSAHPRDFWEGRTIYPVKSRRAHGLSLGVNVNRDKRCSFNCAYCQVDRVDSNDAENPDVLEILEDLSEFIASYKQQGAFMGMELKDIALAGDGEPTLYGDLPELLTALLDVKQDFAKNAKLILFTNGSNLERQDLEAVWPRFFAEGGEVWFKMDFWDALSLKEKNGIRIEPDRLTQALLHLAKRWPVTLQSCFYKAEGEELDFDIAEKFAQNINQNVLAEGGRIQLIQVYTLARKPKDLSLVALDNQEMDLLFTELKSRLSLPMEVFYAC